MRRHSDRDNEGGALIRGNDDMARATAQARALRQVMEPMSAADLAAAATDVRDGTSGSAWLVPLGLRWRRTVIDADWLTEMTSAVIDFCLLLALVAAPAALAVRAWYRPWQRARRAMLRRCAECGYDIRATRDLCPECGEPRHHQPMQRTATASSGAVE